MADTAFHEEQSGPPVDSGPLGPTNDEMGRPAFEKQQQADLATKRFNRAKMGGFIMELGINILASNREDVGGAIGEAFNATSSARTERRRISAAENLATQERERRTRREDASDILKQEKADRDITKAERDKLDRIQDDDGYYEYVDVKKGKVYGEDGTLLRGTTKADKNKLTLGQERIDRRDAQRRLDDMMGAIKDTPSDEDEEILGYSPTEADTLKLAISRLSKRDQALLGKIEDEVEDYKERHWGE